MARRVVVQLVDDLDGRDIEDGTWCTVKFSLDQVGFEIDLSVQHP
ncbi:histone-like nucleoid-structuring protein Lsr2 [Nocardioides psychrotolerans]